MSDISIIGGITANVEGSLYGKLIYGEFNPGKISVAYGGTGRNIAENLARLGADTALVSAVGDDSIGRGAVAELAALGVNTERICKMEGEDTAMSLSVLNIVRDTELGLRNMEIIEKLSPEVLRPALEALRRSKILGIDANLTEEALDYIADEMGNVPMFLDPGSVDNAKRTRKIIGRFHTVKPNRAEAEAISGLTILSQDQLMEAGQWFRDKGVKRIFITMSGGGVYYKEGMDEGIIRPEETAIVSAEGAGDAFSAAILDGFVRG
ncbi:MAG: PfkB family carbohydrate kinase, partial [Anaerovorax sp.]